MFDIIGLTNLCKSVIFNLCKKRIDLMTGLREYIY